MHKKISMIFITQYSYTLDESHFQVQIHERDVFYVLLLRNILC